MDYLTILIALCLLIFFYRLGEMDDELRPVHGLITGTAVLTCHLLFPGGYLRLLLYAAAGFAALTAFKILRGR